MNFIHMNETEDSSQKMDSDDGHKFLNLTKNNKRSLVNVRVDHRFFVCFLIKIFFRNKKLKI